eukprot:TRINITY_DN11560_c0_g1_i1.p1 TRINITY_DN11560_c0_g1~~TRINITY_DN11560_c0_g1_i1.p1  ORF type:complete len:426 (-),score=99.81 TRINITY_DN11560_c0_g1_i1:404-1681(-)
MCIRDSPLSRRHPTVFAVKRRMQELKSQGSEILVYCDLHGHSKLLNSFMYACHKVACGSFCSWTKVRLLPRMLASKCYLFDYHQCSFRVEPDKVNTARVIVWKEFKVTNSFTLESSMFAYTLGEEIAMFQERDYFRLGESLVTALNDYLKLNAHIQELADGAKAGRLVELTGVPAADLLRLEIQEYKAEEKKRERLRLKTQKEVKTPIGRGVQKSGANHLNCSVSGGNKVGNKCISNKELLADDKKYKRVSESNYRNQFTENNKNIFGGTATQANINFTQDYSEDETLVSAKNLPRKATKKKSFLCVYLTDAHSKVNNKAMPDPTPSSNYRKYFRKNFQPPGTNVRQMGKGKAKELNQQHMVTNGIALKTPKRPVSSNSRRHNIFKRFVVNAKDVSIKLRNVSYMDSRKAQRSFALNYRGDKSRG